MRRTAGRTPSKSSAAAWRPGQAQVSWNTSPPAEAKWSLPITWADAHRLLQTTCISFVLISFFFKTWLETKPRDSHTPGKCSATDYSPSSKHLYFQSFSDEADASEKVSHAVRSADSLYCGPHGCMSGTGSGSRMEEDTVPVCLSRSLNLILPLQGQWEAVLSRKDCRNETYRR